MSIYEEGGAAFFAQVPTDRVRHWPEARRESWLRGWNNARVKAAWAL
ncbi:MAG: hypothetical protein Q7J32_13940 [Sphingomonadaceae bacterium]|nr:hypothetical protein [Sphingomonadaceae bacterium]